MTPSDPTTPTSVPSTPENGITDTTLPHPATRGPLVDHRLRSLKTQLTGLLFEMERSAADIRDVLEREPSRMDEYSINHTVDDVVDLWTLGNRALSVIERYRTLVEL